MQDKLDITGYEYDFAWLHILETG